MKCTEWYGMEAVCVWSGAGLILILTDRLFCTNLKGKGTCLQCSLVSWLQVPLTIFSIVIVAVMTLKGALSMSHALQPMKKSALHFVARLRCVYQFLWRLNCTWLFRKVNFNKPSCKKQTIMRWHEWQKFWRYIRTNYVAVLIFVQVHIVFQLQD